MRALLVKMSSLGDVVHALPAVTDAAAHGVEFDWVVEEAYASIPRSHPGVKRVLPIAWRRWRKSLVTNRRAIGDFVGLLRGREYDLVLDAQGLLKSAAVTGLARAPVKAGPDYASAREGISAIFYNQRLSVPRAHHAVDRVRTLFAETFGYTLEGRPEVFGLNAPVPVGSRRCLLLHGTTWSSKQWPDIMWSALARRLVDAGWEVELPWGNPEERTTAGNIARETAGARVLEEESLEDLGRRIAASGLVIGLDSGLAHLAGASGVPTVVVYGATSVALTGCRGARVVNLQSDLACSPCLDRDCRYRGAPLKWRDEVVSPACYSRVAVEDVWDAAMKLLEP